MKGEEKMKLDNCFLCKKKINVLKDKYVHIQDFNKLKLETDKWCHHQCFKKAINRELTDMEKQAQALLNQAQGVFNKLGGVQPVYEVK